MGLEPTRNFRKGYFEKAEDISGQKIKETLPLRKDSCFACTVRCKKTVEYRGKTVQFARRYGSPQWESIGSLGPNCEIGDLLSICKANELCNRYGLDTISTGVTVAFAMECFEKGIISETDTGGIDLRFGNAAALLQIIEQIAYRRGFGDVLAEGSYRAARRIGDGAERYAMTVKKQELPAHEPRGKWGVGLGYAISPTGADHLVAAHDGSFEKEGQPEVQIGSVDISDLALFGPHEPVSATSLSAEKIRLYFHLELLWSLYDVLDMCKFVGVPTFRMMTLEHLIDLIYWVTGWKIGFWELIKISEKSINLTRLFNIKHGFTAADDRLPARMFEPLENGAQKGMAIDREEFQRAVRLYYQIHGWDDEGIPTLGKLIELGIEGFAAEEV
jgi:aldehyde:ferredoxin oxidoreductase